MGAQITYKSSLIFFLFQVGKKYGTDGYKEGNPAMGIGEMTKARIQVAVLYRNIYIYIYIYLPVYIHK